MMKKMILDTDIGPDCDDAAALALLNRFADRGFVEPLAVTHCTSSPYGVGAIRAIDDWYGHDYPVGTMKRGGFLDDAKLVSYGRALSERVAPARRGAEDAVRLLRGTLAAQADAGCEMVAIGPLGNLADLLASPPDELSPLNGAELAARKCARLTLMAGCFPPEAPLREPLPEVEWNVQMDVPAARAVLEGWRGEMVWCGFEVGIRIVSGGAMKRALPADHPVRVAYALHGAADGRPSWDLMTVAHACVPGWDALTEGEPGEVEMDAAGVTRFFPRAGGRHRVLRIAKDPRRIAEEMDALLTAREVFV